jgi:hypothetical protein
MKPPIYIETTIVSYLTARPTDDVVRLSHQLLTRQWWEKSPKRFERFISPLVLREASGGDQDAADRRLTALHGLKVLAITPSVTDLAIALASGLRLPPQARPDSIHVAAAAVHGMSYLLTWNCRHIANAVLADTIEQVCAAHRARAPRICTPEQLMEQP